MAESKAVEIVVPAAVSELRLLDRVDYQDAFSVDTHLTRGAEQWMRAFAEGAPRWFQVSWIGLGKLLVGMRFGPLFNAPDHVVGWKVIVDRPDAFATGLDSSGGLSARLVTVTPPGQAIIATQVRLDTKYARTLWSAIRGGHRHLASYLLDRAAAHHTEGADPPATDRSVADRGESRPRSKASL